MAFQDDAFQDDAFQFDSYTSTPLLDYVSYLRRVDMGYQIGQGDREPDIILEAGVNGEPVDLSDATSYVVRWWKPSGAYVERAITAVDLAVGRFALAWAVGDTDEVGTHRARIRVVRGNGEAQTFPSDGSFVRWRVS